ncbi:MAG TPA: PAS domain S-box protein [Polyangiaceae bacterium]|nr:PAS domain S-box protein [Polyangiaceae bacterium]
MPDALDEGEARVLELVAADTPLEHTLRELALLFEAQAEGMLASILFVQDGKMRHAAAPSLPAQWREAVDGEPIGPNRGSCGTAAYLKEPVIVTDISTDLRWAAYRDVALSLGLRACWSTPIMGSERDVVGTFAFYYREPREPTPRLLALAARASRLATVAFQRHRHQVALHESEQHLALVYNHSGDVLYQLGVEPEGYRFLSVNPMFTKATGIPAEAVRGKWVHEIIPEPSLSLVLEKYAQAIRARTTVRWEELTPYPTGLRRGDVAITPVYDADGQARYLIGSVRDITEQYEMARELAELRQREQLHAVFDVTPSALAIARDERILYANPRFRSLFGMPADADPGVVQGSVSELLALLQATVDAAGSIEWQTTRDGAVVDLLATRRPLEYAGQPSVLLHLVDVTELKRAERSVAQVTKRLQMATRGAKIGVWSWDLATGVIQWDDVMHRLYGVDAEQAHDYKAVWQQRTHADDFLRVDRALRDALAGRGPLEAEFRIWREDGSERHIKANAVIERDEAGKGVRLVGTNWDITDAKRAEEALRQAKEAAEAATRAKSLFLANMSHEIRTPMNAVLGYAQLLQRDESLGQSQRRSLEVIHTSGQHLLNLISDILEMSKIEAGRTTLTLRAFDLHANLRELERMFLPLVREKGLEFGCELGADVPRAVTGDAVKIQQVLINLVSNAVKFTERGRVRVHVSATRTEGGQLVKAAIEDTGPGIAAADQRHIFDAFAQSETGLRGRGTGLGLAISAHFAKLMGGAVEVVSVPGEGSTFTFTFCVGSAETSEVAEPARLPVAVGLAPGQAAPRILVVDDVENNRELLVEVLSRVGFETLVAKSGEEALDLHATFQPDLVLMDLRMPGMDGLETTARLRASGSRAAILALTASSLSDAEAQARASGADGFLRKPYREPELLALVGEKLGVQFTYAGAEPASSRARTSLAPRSLAEQLGRLPAELRAELRDAAERARAGRLVELVAQVRAYADSTAEELEELAASFRYEVLLEALDQVEAT